MSPPGLRASLSLLLLLGGCLLLAAAGNKDAAPGPGSGSSGRFVSPEQHACSWQLRLPAPGAAAGGEVGLRCRGPDGARQECAFRGEPERCAAYGPRRAHYWKQVLGALRRRRRPCLDPAPLRARLCAGKKGRGAELSLVPHAAPSQRPAAHDFSGALRVRARSPGRSLSSRPKEKTSEKKTKGGKRKTASDPGEERPVRTGPNPDGLDENDNAELTETYCDEKWHSVCNFFLNFWNG
ncbi:fibroblast growth factor-binding protein 3 [Heterocephalus glaber]|uniref:Fibroblast growth factor-binding protein 3 n=1 Tax=Heterocephalus glaber TaxID=10181 RepID=A0AAX6NWK5_HETGA|nr:fibroblast growth factor-binding protein 3 [Heterocephalus glaber]XP_004838563.1 fibroblast growth factor-binding protein 3 [Heterocephalus glaber]